MRGLELVGLARYCALLGPMLLPSLGIINWLNGERIFQISAKSFWIVFAVLYGVYLVSTIAASYVEFRSGAKFFERSFEGRELWSWLRSFAPFAIITLIIWAIGLPFLGIRNLPYGDLIGYLFWAIVLLFVANRLLLGSGAGTAKASQGFDLDDSPLRAELHALANQARVRINAIRVYPLPKGFALDTETVNQLAARRQAWWNSIAPPFLTIPLDIVRDLNSSTLTAAIASKFARWEIQRGLIERFPITNKLNLTVQKFLRSALLLFTIIACPVLGLLSMRAPTPIPYLVYSSLLLLCAGFLVHKLMVRRRLLSSSVILRGAEIWRNAEPHSCRTIEDYLLATLQFNQKINPNIPPDNLLQFNLRAESIHAFLLSLDEATRLGLITKLQSALLDETTNR